MRTSGHSDDPYQTSVLPGKTSAPRGSTRHRPVPSSRRKGASLVPLSIVDHDRDRPVRLRSSIL
jgi:hypothetical protein